MCILAPDHSSDDQLLTRGNSVVACTEAVALHTVHSVANTHTHDRCTRRRRAATAESNACCSSISAASCRGRLWLLDRVECSRVYDQTHLHSRTCAGV